MRRVLILLLALLAIPAGGVAHAKGGGKLKKRVLGGYHTFSGLKSVSLGGRGATAFGLELGAERALAPFVGFHAKLRAEMGAGQATFNDSGSERVLSFSSMHGTVGAGFRLYLLGDSGGLRPYAAGTGLLGFNQLGLPAGSYTVLETSAAAMSLGYELAAGVGFGDDTSAVIEAQLRSHSATFNTNSTSLGGFAIVVGIEF